MIKEAVQILKQFEVQQDATLEQQLLVIVEKRPGKADITQKKNSAPVSVKLSSLVSAQKLELIRQEFSKREIGVDLEKEGPTGELFKNYGEISYVEGGEKMVLEHRAGEVLLVHLWSFWCSPCVTSLTKIHQMMVKYGQKWEGRVRVVALSRDEQQMTVSTIKENRWSEMTQLSLQNNCQHPILIDLSIQSVPFVCLVNPFGKIEYSGHPMQIQLESEINQLISQQGQKPETKRNGASVEPNQKEEEEEEEEEDEEGEDKEEEEEEEEEIERFVQSIQRAKVEEHFTGVDLFCYRYAMTTQYERGCFNRTMKLEGYVMDLNPDDYTKAQSFFKIPKGVEFKLKKANYIKIPDTNGAKCWNCLVQLDFPFYWLKWESQNGAFGCRNCIEAASNQETKHFRYENNSILMLGEWEAVAVKNLGTNSQPKDPKAAKEAHQFSCTCCKKKCYEEVGAVRYICLGCRANPNFLGNFCDVCETCLEKLVTNDEEAMKTMDSHGHLPNHPVLRVLYATNGYYTF